MSDTIVWIAAEGGEERNDELLEALGEAEMAVPQTTSDYTDESSDMYPYRDRTVALLRRYLRYSLETGRVPSLLGREFFRTTVTSYTVTTFEDRVVFAHDVERCLERLDGFSQKVLARVVLQEYGQEEAARLLHCSRSTLARVLWIAIDELSTIFLEVGILEDTVRNMRMGREGVDDADVS